MRGINESPKAGVFTHKHLVSPNKSLTQQLLAKLKACDECKHNPVVFLTAEAIPVCAKHWAGIADSNLEW